MPINVFCPECGKTYKVKDEFAGKAAKCPQGHSLVIPRTGDDEPLTLSENDPAEPPTAAERVSFPVRTTKRTGAAGKKHCPSCGEELPAKAVLCVECGYDLRKGKKIAGAAGAGSGTRRAAVACIGAVALLGVAVAVYFTMIRESSPKASPPTNDPPAESTPPALAKKSSEKQPPVLSAKKRAEGAGKVLAKLERGARVTVLLLPGVEDAVGRGKAEQLVAKAMDFDQIGRRRIANGLAEAADKVTELASVQYVLAAAHPRNNENLGVAQLREDMGDEDGQEPQDLADPFEAGGPKVAVTWYRYDWLHFGVVNGRVTYARVDCRRYLAVWPKPAISPEGVQDIAASFGSSSGKTVKWRGQVLAGDVVLGDSKNAATTYRVTLKLKSGALPLPGNDIIFTGTLRPGVSRGEDFLYNPDGSRTALTTVYLNVDDAVVVSAVKTPDPVEVKVPPGGEKTSLTISEVKAVIDRDRVRLTAKCSWAGKPNPAAFTVGKYRFESAVTELNGVKVDSPDRREGNVTFGESAASLTFTVTPGIRLNSPAGFVGTIRVRVGESNEVAIDRKDIGADPPPAKKSDIAVVEAFDPAKIGDIKGRRVKWTGTSLGPAAAGAKTQMIVIQPGYIVSANLSRPMTEAVRKGEKLTVEGVFNGVVGEIGTFSSGGRQTGGAKVLGVNDAAVVSVGLPEPKGEDPPAKKDPDKRKDAQPDEDEKAAADKLKRLRPILSARGVDDCRDLLKDIIKQHPKTKAADEAAALLKSAPKK
jgi:hypothetical protein